MKNAPSAFTVGFFVWREDKEVIHINDEPSFSNHVSEGVIYELLESGWGIGESEEHDRWFKEAFVSDEGSLSLVAIFDVDIVVAPLDVKLGE